MKRTIIYAIIGAIIGILLTPITGRLIVYFLVGVPMIWGAVISAIISMIIFCILGVILAEVLNKRRR